MLSHLHLLSHSNSVVQGRHYLLFKNWKQRVRFSQQGHITRKWQVELTSNLSNAKPGLVHDTTARTCCLGIGTGADFSLSKQQAALDDELVGHYSTAVFFKVCSKASPHLGWIKFENSNQKILSAWQVRWCPVWRQSYRRKGWKIRQPSTSGDFLINPTLPLLSPQPSLPPLPPIPSCSYLCLRPSNLKVLQSQTFPKISTSICWEPTCRYCPYPASTLSQMLVSLILRQISSLQSFSYKEPGNKKARHLTHLAKKQGYLSEDQEKVGAVHWEAARALSPATLEGSGGFPVTS